MVKLRDRWQQRQTRLLALYDQILRGSSARAPRIVRIESILQHSRNGTKAIVQLVDGSRWDAFFWHSGLRRGAVLLVDGSFGWGAHRGRHTLYVGGREYGHGIQAQVPSPAWRAARRRARRT